MARWFDMKEAHSYTIDDKYIDGWITDGPDNFDRWMVYVPSKNIIMKCFNNLEEAKIFVESCFP